MWNTPLFPIFAYDAYHYLRKPVEDSQSSKDRRAEALRRQISGVYRG